MLNIELILKYLSRDINNPRPKYTAIGHKRSPSDTPRTKEKPDLIPPDTVRAIIAIQTGPGVKNKMISAPK